jgi:crotonobetainyl-CoA:carnitine CoA-transferase CaiB-like acyl-CoA transferase
MSAPTRRPLDGVRIVDLTAVWSGPYATMFLADMGAEVIRVENPWLFPSSTRGYVARPTAAQAAALGGIGGGYPDGEPGDRPWNRHLLFTCHARNKMSMTLDIRKPLGRELLLKLVERSHLVVENNSAGFLEKFDIGWDVLSHRNPGVSLLRMPPLGMSGPYREFVGFGANFEALCGITALRGYPGDDPALLGQSAYMDAVSGAAGAFAAMLALLRRRRTGHGSLVELAQADNLFHVIGEYFVHASMGEGPAIGPMGNRDFAHCPQGAYPCRGEDRWIVISVGTDDEWSALRALMGEPGWASDPLLDNAAGRRANQDMLDENLARWTADWDATELFHRCQAVGVPAGPTMSEADAFADPQLTARGYFRELTAPDTGTHRYPGYAWTWQGLDLAWDRPAPALGEHNEYVYRDVLGLTDEEFGEAVADGHVSRDYLDASGHPL